MNEAYWKETKYKVHRGMLIPTDDRRYLNGSSYLTAAITADYYSEYIPKYVKGVTADLGCGFAPMYQYYKEYTEKVICIDWANSLHKNKILDMRCDLSKPLDLEDGSIDTVILSDVLEHIFNPKSLLREIYRILRADGTVLLNTPFTYPEHEKPYDYFRYTEFFFRKMVKEIGYELAVIKKVGGEREVILTLIGKYMGKYGGNCTGLVEWINKFAYRKWRRNRKNSGEDTCLGYFVILRKRCDQNRDCK